MTKKEKINIHRRVGVLAPLFSVYSKNSTGIGDLGDLKLLIDWCFKTGNSILQLLPMNEAGPLFCPYDAISSFGLEPAYISLKTLDAAKNKSIKDKIKELRKHFPLGKPHVGYRIKDE
ncbi:MAG: 4-alpha-glucanotransferase, partial [Candidatus Omnitrophica bacterium]|nr:4-alpha-glucanotransferase [Candidatus Omnitrophota bacterium]